MSNVTLPLQYIIDANEMAKNVSTPSLEEEALIRLP